MKKLFSWYNEEGKISKPKSKRCKHPAQLGLFAFVVFCLALLVWDVSSNGGVSGFAQLSRPAMVQGSDTLSMDSDSSVSDEMEDPGNSEALDASADWAEAEVFAAYRMDREQSRADELALLQEVIEDEASSEEARQQAEQRKIQVAANIEAEARAESLLDAEGFGETVVMMGTDQATVICAVQLDAVTATRIAEVVSTTCLINFENVVIVNRNAI